MSDLWDIAARLHDAYRDQPTPIQLGQLTTEVGEVWDAYIGMTGANPRKGTTGCPADVTAELWDVIITAMVALHHFADDPHAAAPDYLDKYEHRLAAAGTPADQDEQPDLCADAGVAAEPKEHG